MSKSQFTAVAPGWLRPVALFAAIILHAGLVFGFPWLAVIEPPVDASIAINVVAEGNPVPSMAALSSSASAEVSAAAGDSVDSVPVESQAIEQIETADQRQEEITETAPAEVAEAPPVDRAEAAVDPPAQTETASSQAEIRVADAPAEMPPSRPPERPAVKRSTQEPVKAEAKPPEKPEKPEKPKPPKQRVVEEKSKKGKPTPRSTASSASSASSTAQAASVSAASGAAASANYRSLVAAELNRRKFYPEGARASGVTGVVVVSFKIGASGTIASHKITRSSGNGALDGAISQMIASVSLPPPPGGSFSATVPIHFDVVR